RHKEEIEVMVKGPKDVQPPLLPAEDPSITTSRPARPIPPPGTSHVGMPGAGSQPPAEETMTSEDPGQQTSGPVHPRFSRRPVHESFGTPLTPPPPISPTFEDSNQDKANTK
ncbi:MAG: hypothetical protein HY758_10115, partial [Nitrospirae bacterium]|nr:hypothetical protein [Nitrospirota bacterium]